MVRLTTGTLVEAANVDVVEPSVEFAAAKLVSVTVGTVDGVVEDTGLLNGFVGFVDSVVGLGFATVLFEASMVDKGTVFSVVVVYSGLTTGFVVVVLIFVGFVLRVVVSGLEAMVDGLEVVVRIVDGLIFCTGFVVVVVSF